MSQTSETPARFTATRIIRAKSSPTTQVTTIEPDWDQIFQETTLRESKSISDDFESKRGASDSGSTLHSGVASLSHGLLTPHGSISKTRTVQDYYSAQCSFPSTGSAGDVSDISEIRFASREESALCDDEPTLYRFSRLRASGPSPSDRISYASVGVQTSLPNTSSSYVSTRPPSPISPTTTPTASPKRKRRGTPEYIRQGAKLAQELADDLIFLAQEKRRLRRSLARIVRKERDCRSFLVPLTNDSEEKDTDDSISDDSISDEGSDSDRRILFPRHGQLTPVSSDLENGTKAQSKSLRPPNHASPILLVPTEHSSTSDSGFSKANIAPHDESSARENNNESASTDGMLRVPSYTYAEGAVTPSSMTSTEERVQKSRNDGLAPNPVRDPSTYLVWFDLEIWILFYSTIKTTDAVRPAANIRILEVAVFISDRNYQPLDRGKSFIVHWPLSAEEIALEMPERVREMHNKSGLLDAYANTPAKDRLTLAQVERRLRRYLERHDIGTDGRAIMAGAGVAFDRGMVRQHMEKLNAYFSHQIFDTTTLWHAVRRKYSRTKRFSEMCVHRALDDIVESCREAKLYSEIVLKPAAEVQWPIQSSQGI
ncbi:REXO2_1 [Sanghuangporus vaninii]